MLSQKTNIQKVILKELITQVKKNESSTKQKIDEIDWFKENQIKQLNTEDFQFLILILFGNN